MATSNAGEFERALARLEEIVARLESEDVSLDDSVELYREGRKLSARCETLLKSAQESIAAASEIEEPPLPPPPPRNTPSRVPRRDEDVLDLDIPF